MDVVVVVVVVVIVVVNVVCLHDTISHINSHSKEARIAQKRI